jgi:hypothetical protein
MRRNDLASEGEQSLLLMVLFSDMLILPEMMLPSDHLS